MEDNTGRLAGYCADIVCSTGSALLVSDKGQAEAARTLGFSAWATFRLVTLPQVLSIAKPVYQSTIVNLIQWTSVDGLGITILKTMAKDINYLWEGNKNHIKIEL